MPRTIIIAEIGECWNGDDASAGHLIEVAASAGCDYAKFQMLDRNGIAPDDPERDWFLKLALDESRLRKFQQHAHACGIGFLVTPENAAQVPLVAGLPCEAVKIASSCLIDDELLRAVDGRFRRVFLSTGLAELSEVDHAVGLLGSVEELFLLHCVAEYPTGVLLEERGLKALDDADVRLAMMSILAERYPQARAGYSDHTVGLAAPLAAVAAGAAVIEKHITLDRRTPARNFLEGGPYLGTDHVLSLEPDELRAMVEGIRHVERILGERTWERSAGELRLRSFLRERFRWSS
jgi:N,N'-diacetyllegionaminate synthase